VVHAVSGARRTPSLPEVGALHAAVVIAGWRRAALRPRDAAGLALGWLAAIVSGSLLVLASFAFCFVGRTLLSSLLDAGRIDLAVGVAGLLTDASLLVAVLAVALTDPLRSGLDPRPLSVLPLKRSERLAADLAALVFAHPAALAFWAAGVALFLGSAAHRPGVGWTMLPAATGVVVLGASVSLAARRLLLLSRDASTSRVAGVLLRAAILVVPSAGLVWIGASGGSLAQHDGLTLTPTPGGLVGGAVRLAAEHRLLAATYGGLLHLSALLLLASIVRLPLSPDPSSLSGRRSWWPGVLPIEAARIWRPTRASGLFLQGALAAAMTVGVAALAEPRAPSGWPVAETGALLAVWILVSSVAPLSANALGHGGRAAASHWLLPESLARSVARAQAWTSLPILAGVAAVAAASALASPSARIPLLALAAGLGLAIATAGLGCVSSVLWPWPSGMNRQGDPLWAPGPGRLLISVGHGLVLALAASSLFPARETLPAATRAAAAGLILGLGGWLVTLWRLRRRRAEISEALLR